MCQNFLQPAAQFHEVCTPLSGLENPGEAQSLQAYPRLHAVRPRLPRVLLVEPHVASSAALQRKLTRIADVLTSSTFQFARFMLRERPPDLLITNLRLAAYNGLHLVFMATRETRSVVYSTVGFDRALALEAQRRAAFYESGSHLLTALPAYINALLPERDRRDVTAFDRRSSTRGGRRAPDASRTLQDRTFPPTR